MKRILMCMLIGMLLYSCKKGHEVIPAEPLAVTYPKGGEIYYAGQSISITWKGTIPDGMMLVISITSTTNSDFAITSLTGEIGNTGTVTVPLPVEIHDFYHMGSSPLIGGSSFRIRMSAIRKGQQWNPADPSAESAFFAINKPQAL